MLELDQYNGVIFFDGYCHLCSSSMVFIAKRDRRRLYRFCAMQTPKGRQIAEELKVDPDAPQSFLLIHQKKVLLSSDAAIEIGSSFGGPWKLLRLLKIIPGKVRNAVYSFIARNRYKWFGRHDQCFLGDSNIRSRSIC